MPNNTQDGAGLRGICPGMVRKTGGRGGRPAGILESPDSRLLGRLSVQSLKTSVALHFVVRLSHFIKNFAKCVSVLRSNPFGTNDPAEDLECRSRARRRLSALAKAKQVRVDGLQVVEGPVGGVGKCVPRTPQAGPPLPSRFPECFGQLALASTPEATDPPSPSRLPPGPRLRPSCRSCRLARTVVKAASDITPTTT